MISEGPCTVGFHYLWNVHVEESNKHLVTIRDIFTKHFNLSIISI